MHPLLALQFLLIGMLSVPLSAAEEQERPLDSVLNEMEERYQVFFNYEAALVAGQSVRYQFLANEATEEAISRLLTPLELDYELIDGRFVMLNPAKRKNPSAGFTSAVPPGTSILPAVPRSAARAPLRRLYSLPDRIDALPVAITVSGVVTDDSGTTLIGVNVLEEGTSNGTVTDVDGRYTINVTSETSVLLFSYLGYTNRRMEVGTQTTIDVELGSDVSQLEEIVVIGYGTQRRSDVTGSVVSVTTDKTDALPNQNILQSIQGRVPGLNVFSPERPGQDPQLRIRGNNSLTASNSPLIVVDNIIYNGQLSDFNPNDIASVDILKDASAAAVYGARAANGVILLTTKQGKTEKPTFNVSTYYGIQEPESLVTLLDGAGYEQKIADYNAIILANNPDATPIELTNVERANRDAGMETNWVDRSLRTGTISNYHIDVSGRTGRTSYYLAGTYFREEGIAINDDFDRATLNLNLSNKITDWYTVAVNTSYTHKDYSGVEASLQQAVRISPYGDFFDEDGPGGYAFLPFGDPLGEHPLIRTIYDDLSKSSSLRGVLSSQLEVPFVRGLKWTLNYAGNVRESRNNRFLDNVSSVNGQLNNGIATKNFNRFTDWTLDNIINYNRVFAERHAVSATLLYSRENRRFDFSNARAENFVSQELGYNNLGLGEVQTVNSNFEEQNTIAQMARLNYSYDNRYSVTFTVRRDGFSAFAANNKYGTFPAVALAWTVSDEGWLRDNSVIDYLKLRLSWGRNGNQGIDRYSSLARIGINQYLFGNGGSSIATFGVSSLANSNLSWETTTARNLGFDFKLFDGRLGGTLDVYSSNTTDLLQRRRLPTITGFNSLITNIGEVENRGVEFSLNGTLVQTAAVRWDPSIIFSLNRNEIVSLGGLDADGDGQEDDDISNGWFIGEPAGAIFGFQTDGIYQIGDEIPPAYRPGDFRIVDTDGDGQITPRDRTILGLTDPNFLISIGNTVSVGNFSLYILLNGAAGGGDKNYYVGDNFETRSVNDRNNTTYSERFNLADVPYWTPDNPTNEYPRLDYNPPFRHPILESRGFLRIQDVSLSYNFGEAVLTRTGLSNLRVYASAKNLHTFTDWSGYNPETQTTVRDLPFISTYTAGVNFSF
jgi:TonB-linked SusC/RagA family outer membrane protein